MTSSEKPCIAFIGLGAMGFGMAANLVKQGYPVKGFDVFQASLDRFKEKGGAATASLAEVAEGCLYCVCMVATAAQVEAVVFEHKESLAKKALAKGATLLLCSTTPSVYAQSVEDQLKREGRDDIYLVDCPVSGGPKRASEGTLSIMAGGSDPAIRKARFLLEEMADTGKLAICPGGIGAGSNMKMAHQVLAAIHILATSEAMGLAARLGLDMHQVRDAVIASEAWSFVYENRSPRLINREYTPPASALTIILKDVGIVTSMARLRQFPTPLSSVAEQVYLSGLALGLGSEDDAGLIRLYSPEAISLPPNSTESTKADTSSSIALIINLLRGIHLCAAAESITFANHFGLEPRQFFEVVNTAAGASWIFRERGPNMIRGQVLSNKSDWVAEAQGQEENSIETSVETMSAVVQAARDVNCPLYLGNVTLNLLLSMKRRGWDGCPDDSVVKFWDCSDG